MRPRFRWLSIACVLLCAACAAPSADMPRLPAGEVAAERRRQELAQVRDYYAQLHRVDSVAFRIRTANSAACGEWVSAQIGLYAITPRSLPSRFRSFSAEALDLRWVRATVISVVEGSPAAKAGIRNGDELISFNGEPVPVGGTMGWMGGFLRFNGERPVQVALRRNDSEDLTLTVHPMTGCAIPIVLNIDPAPNALTDFKKIVIHSGILRSTKTDADLAVIVGHELAHVNMGHYQKKVHNAFLGALGGALVDGGLMLGSVNSRGTFTRHFEKAGLMAFSVAFEREADYVGAYYASRAGYDIAGAGEIWRRVALELPESTRVATTHPTTPERFVLMQKVVAEIEDKKRRNIALIPDMKTSSVIVPPDADSADADDP